MNDKKPWWLWIARLDAHHRLLISSSVGLLVYFLLPSEWAWFTRGLGAWNSFCLSVLLLAWLTIVHADPSEVAKTARLQDAGRTTIFVFVVIAACASLFTVGVLLGTAKGLSHSRLTEHVIFSVGTVLCSWTLVHTVFTLRYAHVFYDLGEDNKRGGGLNFPDEENPDYLDFAYFSFVIGMTCQVSDVGISSRRLRRLALVHGLITFGFNTAIVAMSVNLISGLFS